MVFVFCNANKPKPSSLKAIENTLSKLGQDCYVSRSFPATEADLKQLEQSSAILSLGGDGTVLALFDALVRRKATHIPILPVHFGTLGFISSVDKGDLARVLGSFLSPPTESAAEHKLDSRRFLSIQFGEKVFYALNEVYISRGDLGKPIELTTWVGGVETTKMRSDGIILATPTGSTAYSLSAGGPLIAPGLKVIVYTPVCPHSLTSKPLVIDGGKLVEVRTTFKERSLDAQLIVDGVFRAKMGYGDSIRCKLARNSITFLKPKEENAYSILKDKLGWLRY